MDKQQMEQHVKEFLSEGQPQAAPSGAGAGMLSGFLNRANLAFLLKLISGFLESNQEQQGTQP